MAQNLSVSVTLEALRSNIRRKTGKLGQQESGLRNEQLNAIVHSAILAIRLQYAEILNQYYQRSESISFGAISSGIATASIAALNLANISDPRLRATLSSIPNKTIRIVGRGEYDNEVARHSVSEMTTTGAIGTIYLTSGTPNVLTVEIYTGASAIASAVFSYLKNPVKVTVGTDTVDIPDLFTPLVENYAADMILGQPIQKEAKK